MSLQRVIKETLPNGMNVLVFPDHRIPKVSLQLWYNVGSRDEKPGERGLAHLIEHMIFKGTKNLSESDINLIVHKLSGYCNAFTSYDYTGYLFDLPTQHWYEALPIMADCMRNCTFKEEFLQSELKAVIQELKMYNDDYHSTLLEKLTESIFPDHPYHYPVIGYKHDLWSLTRDALVRFYEHHYVPNNATLVVAGNVTSDDVIARALQCFGALTPDASYRKDESYHSTDLSSVNINLYRDIQQPVVLFCWVVPGAREKKDFVLDAVSWILGGGKGSRLYRNLVDKHQLVTDVESFVYDLFDYGLFVVQVQPHSMNDLEKIKEIIHREIDDLIQAGPTEQELTRAIKKTEMDHLGLFESNQKLAYLVGKYFLATGDENYVVDYCKYSPTLLQEEVVDIIRSYLRPTVMHQGAVVPFPQTETKEWLALQERSDSEDQRILSRIERTLDVEDGRHVHTIASQNPALFNYPRAHSFMASNGLKVFFAHQLQTPKIDIILDFKAKHIYDPAGKEGLSLFVSDMLLEGTTTYDMRELTQEFDRLGINISTFPGQIVLSVLRPDLERALGLLGDILMNSILPAESMEKIRSRLLAEHALFLDEAGKVAVQSVKELIYHNHPYSKNILGSKESLQAITRHDVQAAYDQWITPVESRLMFVGDLTGVDLERLVEKQLGRWQRSAPQNLRYPVLNAVHYHEYKKFMNRDQTVLCYGGMSVDRFNQDFDKLLLFDQVFGGGVLGSMSSRLFDLRERSGLFYTIGGSLIAGVDKQPGMILIKTIVSNDRLAEAERSIEYVINTAVDSLTEEELQEAKQAINNSLVDNFASNRQTAASLLFLDYYNFPADYFDHRSEQLAAITLDEVKQVVKKYLRTDAMIKIKVGRV